jgi:hypothetical protein
MAATKKSAIIAEKLACYDRVVEILQDRLALERHRRRGWASFDAILSVREDAYIDLVRAVLGHDALYKTESEEPQPARKRQTVRKAKCATART